MESSRTGRMLAEIVVLSAPQEEGSWNKVEQHGLTVELVDFPKKKELAAALGAPTDGTKCYQVTDVKPGSAGANAGVMILDWLMCAYKAKESDANPGLDLSQVEGSYNCRETHFRTVHDEETRDECLTHLMDPTKKDIAAIFGRVFFTSRRQVLVPYRGGRQVAIQKVRFLVATVDDCRKIVLLTTLQFL